MKEKKNIEENGIEEKDIDEDLENKEYMIQGEGNYTDEKGNPCSVRIRLRAYPGQGTAFTDTWTQIGEFSMHLESEVTLENIP